MKLINGIVKEQAALHAGVQYVDIWPLFATANGTYDAKWRAGDGVHLTVAVKSAWPRPSSQRSRRLGAYGLPSAKPTPDASPSVSASASSSP